MARDLICHSIPVKSKQSKGNGAEVAFTQFFPGIRFKKSTFHDHRQCWRHAPASEQACALAGQHTDSGLWSTFMDHNPLKDADVKATRRKAHHIKSESDVLYSASEEYSDE